MPTLATVRASNATWDPSYTPVGVFVGGTSGIGEGIAEVFARHTKGNAHIILIGRNRPAATAILARLEKPPVPGLTREFLPCDLTLIANAKRTAAAIRERFPRINFLFLSAGAVSLKGLDINEEGMDRQMAALYYSKWAFIEGLLPGLRAAHSAGEDARVAALHTAGRGGPVDLDDLGLLKGISGGLKSVRKLVPQLASYQDLMAEVCFLFFSLFLFSFRNTHSLMPGLCRARCKHRHLLHACLPGHGRHAPPARLPVRDTARSALRALPDISHPHVPRDVDRGVR
jgi:NAD(P)-dependent dehydrogenase (short-subunit alcohol dehydrogenase family)